MYTVCRWKGWAEAAFLEVSVRMCRRGTAQTPKHCRATPADEAGEAETADDQAAAAAAATGHTYATCDSGGRAEGMDRASGGGEGGGGCGGGSEALSVQEYIRNISSYAEKRWPSGPRDGYVLGGGVGGGAGRGVGVGVEDRGRAKFPIFVVNLPARSDRRLHMREVLQEIGAEGFFPPIRPFATLDLQLLVRMGHIAATVEEDIAEGNDGSAAPFGAYVANALDQIALIRAAAHLAPFAILEDDLFVAVDRDHVLPLIHRAIDLLPPSADLLYLGWCFEECRRTHYAERATNSDSRRTELMKLVELIKLDGPYCSSSILFTAKGAQRVPELTMPVYNSLDFMYRDLIKRGVLEAYGINAPIFYQDAYWKSDVPGKRKDRGLGPLDQEGRRPWLPRHSSPVAPLCAEQGLSPRLVAFVDTFALAELSTLAQYNLSISEAFDTALNAEELHFHSFSEHFIVIPRYPFLDWAPRCVGSRGKERGWGGGGRGGQKGGGKGRDGGVGEEGGAGGEGGGDGDEHWEVQVCVCVCVCVCV
jgi:hypothetical protein